MNTEAMEQAERTADRIREEFLRTLGEIDRRRVEAMDWRRQLKRGWPVLVAAGAVVALIVTARLAWGRRARKQQVKALKRQRVEALRRAWEHPERLASAGQVRAADLGGKVLTTFGTAFASQVAKKSARRFVG